MDAETYGCVTLEEYKEQYVAIHFSASVSTDTVFDMTLNNANKPEEMTKGVKTYNMIKQTYEE